jgi:MHS family proline/betaine transporter-like MFS transporter
LANLVGALLRSLLNDEQLLDWGWRVAFFTGIFVAPAAIVLQVYGAEHNPNEGEFDNDDDDADANNGIISSISSSLHRKRPISEALKQGNRTALLSSFLTPMLGGAGYYVTFVWMAVFMQTLLDPPVPGAFWVNLIAYICGFLFTGVLAGTLSDKYGRLKMMTVGAVLVGVIAPVMLWIISWGVPWKACLAQWSIGVLLSLFTGPLWAWLPENFSPKVRLTSAAIGYNMGMCVSAGFSPALATALVNGYGPVSAGVI